MASQLLLVDDEPGLREAVQAYLEDSGYAVDVATNGREGLDLARQKLPDLIISDIMMPQVDGYEFLRQLREDPHFKTTPVIFLTARGMTSDRIQGYSAGCDAYIPKPFDPDELVAIVKNLLEKQASIREAAEDDDGMTIRVIKEEIDKIKALLTQRGAIAPTPSDIKIDFTPREQSVLDLVVDGLMNKEIARRLETSVRNVEKYVSRLFTKTGTNSRTELVRFALEHGLISK